MEPETSQEPDVQDADEPAAATTPSPPEPSGEDEPVIDLIDRSGSTPDGDEEQQPAGGHQQVIEPSHDAAPSSDLEQRLAEGQAQAAAWEQARDRALAVEARVADHHEATIDRLAAQDDRVAALELRHAEVFEQLNDLGEEVRAEIMLSGIVSDRRERFADHDGLRATVRTLLRRMSDGRTIDDDDRSELLALGHRTADHWLSDAGRAVVAWAMGDESRGDTAAERAMSTEDQPARWFLAAVAFTQPDLAGRRWETLARALERADPASSPVALDLAELALGEEAGPQGALRAAELLTGWAGEPPGDPVRHDGWVRRVARTTGGVAETDFASLERLDSWDALSAGLKALTVGEALTSRLDDRDVDGWNTLGQTIDPSEDGNIADIDDGMPEDGDLTARSRLLATIEALIAQPEPDEAELLAQELELRDRVGRPQEIQRPRSPDLPDNDRLLWALALNEESDDLGPRSTEVLRQIGRRWMATAVTDHLSATRSLLPTDATICIAESAPLTLSRPEPTGTDTSTIDTPSADALHADALATTPQVDTPPANGSTNEDVSTGHSSEAELQAELQLVLDEAASPDSAPRQIGVLDGLAVAIAVAGAVIAVLVTPWAWIAVGVAAVLLVVARVLATRRASQHRRQRAEADEAAHAELQEVWTAWAAYWGRVDEAEQANAALLVRLATPDGP